MKSKGVSLDAKVVTSGLSKLQQALKSLLMTRLNPLFFLLLIPSAEKLPVWHCTSSLLMDGFTRRALKKWFLKPKNNWKKKLSKPENEQQLIWAYMGCIPSLSAWLGA